MKGFIAEFAPTNIPTNHETLYGTQDLLHIFLFIVDVINNGSLPTQTHCEGLVGNK
jgi:hypothetical protein